jgi:hypothetical protein
MPIEFAAVISFACLGRADHIGLDQPSQSRHYEARRHRPMHKVAAERQSLFHPRNSLLRALMPVRLRKFLGTIALIVLVIVWALVAMALAQAPAIHDSTALSIAYYVIAGMGWVLPAMPIVAWMARPGVSNR